MDVLNGNCDGTPLATVKLPAKPGADGFITLDAALPRSVKGTQDLCVRFTGDTRPTMWVLDTLTLVPR
jgi:hexosaminidase